MLTTLSTAEQKKFYKLYYAAGTFVNNLRKIAPVTRMHPDSCDYTSAMHIVKVMRAHPEDMEKMASESSKLSEVDRNIIASWARMKPGIFAVVDHTALGSYFVSEKDETVFLVLGLRKPLDYSLGDDLPVMLETCLLPFQDKIITDGVSDLYPGKLTKTKGARFMQIYAEAVKNGTVQTTL
ncbi:MAG: hypothetical protein IJ242_09990 [Clostridia bacterium]|nr:hypothetical protein [Clostridia bacterium]